jgi:hypothetical protein
MTLTPDEIGLIEHLIKKLQGHDGKNYLVERYYEGKNKLKDLRISIPLEKVCREV